MLKFCENGSNIEYLYETSSVMRKATETEISGLTFWLRFSSGLKKPKWTEIRFPHIPSEWHIRKKFKHKATNTAFNMEVLYSRLQILLRLLSV